MEDPRSDYVVVGAGSAGAALAYRLVEAGRTVTLVEAGGTDFGPLIQMPAALSYPMNMPRYDWGFVSQPEPHLGGRRLAVPRGKVLGGSSSINGMVFVRGHARDFDTWDQMGATGWAYADVLPYFKRMETWHGGESPFRGTSGPVHVTRGTRKNPLFHAFVEAGRQAGYPLTEDYNGAGQEGFGPMEATIWRGRRWSTANAYLRPAMRSSSLRLVRAEARRVIFDGHRATGIEATRGGATVRLHAEREVILCASSINSPKLLLLSGIGPEAHLRDMGVSVVADRRGVGANLQDHLEVYVQYAAKEAVTLYRYWNLLGKALIGAQWLFTRGGIGASNQFESAGFIRSEAGVEYPDIQLHFLPLAVRYDGKSAVRGHGFQAHVGPMRARSRGTVRLAAPDHRTKPVIRFNAMSDPEDWRDFRRAIRLTREIFAQPAMVAHVAREVQPAAHADKDLDAFIRDHAESAYHPCGTARMGLRDDPGAVVDPDCRVIGVEGLRVADSSVFPRITNGNLNAPSIMVGEKAADHILSRRLPPENLAPVIAANWRTEQR